MASLDSFGAKSQLQVGEESFEFFHLEALGELNLPFTHRVLLENLLRTEDGANVTADQIRTLALETDRELAEIVDGQPEGKPIAQRLFIGDAQALAQPGQKCGGVPQVHDAHSGHVQAVIGQQMKRRALLDWAGLAPILEVRHGTT